MNVFDNYFSGRIAMTFTLPMTSQQVQRIAPMKRTSSILPREDSENLNILKTTYCTEGFAQEIVGLGCSLVAGSVHCHNFLNKDSKLKGKREKFKLFFDIKS